MSINDKRTIQNVHDLQKAFFITGATRSLAFRQGALKALKAAILKHEFEIAEALKLDLGKSAQEVVATEIGFTLNEINTCLRMLPKWSRQKRVPVNWFNTGAKAYTVSEPFGTTLIISPWNYPFQLAISPLIGAIAGGNTAVVKPSEHAHHTAQMIATVIGTAFRPEHVAVVQGAVAETNELLDRRFDKIFFTGSTAVGRFVMEKAAKHLTPVVLELGGKSPCIVDQTSDLKLAAKRILFGKGINAGQTCVAPDYLMVHETVAKAFVSVFKETADSFYGLESHKNPELVKIINRSHFERIQHYLEDGTILYGGEHDEKERRIGLTLMAVQNLEAPIMREEIFGPLLPMLTYKTLEDIVQIVSRNPDPLALYIFSKNKAFVDEVIHRIPFGGGSINDTIMHLTNEHLPFGGRGASGIGSYHGRHSYETFTHQKAILSSPTFFDLPLKYPPSAKKMAVLLRKILYR